MVSFGKMCVNNYVLWMFVQFKMVVTEWNDHLSILKITHRYHPYVPQTHSMAYRHYERQNEASGGMLKLHLSLGISLTVVCSVAIYICISSSFSFAFALQKSLELLWWTTIAIWGGKYCRQLESKMVQNRVKHLYSNCCRHLLAVLWIHV